MQSMTGPHTVLYSPTLEAASAQLIVPEAILEVGTSFVGNSVFWISTLGVGVIIITVGCVVGGVVHAVRNNARRQNKKSIARNLFTFISGIIEN